MLLATSVFNSMVDEDLFPDFSAVIHGNQAACQTSITCANSTGTQTAVSKVINLGLAAGHKRIVHEQKGGGRKVCADFRPGRYRTCRQPRSEELTNSEHP